MRLSLVAVSLPRDLCSAAKGRFPGRHLIIPVAMQSTAIDLVQLESTLCSTCPSFDLPPRGGEGGPLNAPQALLGESVRTAAVWGNRLFLSEADVFHIGPIRVWNTDTA